MPSIIRQDIIAIDVKRQGPTNKIEWETSCDKNNSDFRCFEIFCTFRDGSCSCLCAIHSPARGFSHIVAPNIPCTYWIVAKFHDVRKDFTSGKITIVSDFEDEKTQDFQTVADNLQFINSAIRWKMEGCVDLLERGKVALKIMKKYVETKD